MLKYCAAISLCAGLALSQSGQSTTPQFLTGQAARAIIGQTTFTSQTFGTASNILGSAGGLAFGNNTLFVADSNRLGLIPVNNRVLMFGDMSDNLSAPTASIPTNSRCPVCFGNATNVLGQPNFNVSTSGVSSTLMNLPLGVATDGVHVAVADTSNNRVLIWFTFPVNLDQPADVVLGQPDFNTVQQPVAVNASSMREPEGVWINNGKLFVADTQNSRVLIWNSLPTKNNQPADLVLGQPNFTTVPNFDQTKASLLAAANSMLSPTSVATDSSGTHLIVTDLGFNRVLIWNRIPTANDTPADIEVGQKDLVTAISDDSAELCASNGTDSNNNPTYPTICAATMSFPRFAITDDTRLYVADGGNDRVLIWNTFPTTNGQRADVILGEPDEFSDVVTNANSQFGGTDQTLSASNVTPTPTSLAWDGTNLYVADPQDFRVLVFTPALPNVQTNGVVNAFSQETFANDSVSFTGNVNPGDTATLTINGTDYVYTIQSGDTFDNVTQGLVTKINGANNGAGDPNVIASTQTGTQLITLVARQGGAGGNSITVTTKVSDNAQITVTALTATLLGGGSVSTIAPGSLALIQGTNLSDQTISTPSNIQNLPVSLGGVQVYIDGISAPIVSVSPTGVVVQIPFELLDTNSSNLVVRTVHSDGSITVTNAVGLPIAPDNPGLLALQVGSDPRPAVAFHSSSFATGTITVTGGINGGDQTTVEIEDRSYNYVVQSDDTLATVRDALISLINSNTQEKVTASAAPAFTSIRLQAKVPGPDGDGIVINAVTSGPTSGSAGSVTLTPTNATLCCANVANAPITANNPAAPGEQIYVLGTGLGLVAPNTARLAIADGQAYAGPAQNDPVSAVSSLAGGASATIISAGLEVGAIGIYKIVLELSNSLTTDPLTQITISQDAFTSNSVTIPVLAANPIQ